MSTLVAMDGSRQHFPMIVMMTTRTRRSRAKEAPEGWVSLLTTQHRRLQHRRAGCVYSQRLQYSDRVGSKSEAMVQVTGLSDRAASITGKSYTVETVVAWK